jgi:hypothetical protein
MMWPRVINIVLGVWLMAAPAILGYGGAGGTNDVVVGALSVTSAIVSLSEVMRSIRWFNVAMGMSLLFAPLYLGFVDSPIGHRMFVGLLMLSSALVRGRIKSRFGGGWSGPVARRSSCSARDSLIETVSLRRMPRAAAVVDTMSGAVESLHTQCGCPDDLIGGARDFDGGLVEPGQDRPRNRVLHLANPVVSNDESNSELRCG